MSGQPGFTPAEAARGTKAEAGEGWADPLPRKTSWDAASPPRPHIWGASGGQLVPGSHREGDTVPAPASSSSATPSLVLEQPPGLGGHQDPPLGPPAPPQRGLSPHRHRAGKGPAPAPANTSRSRRMLGAPPAQPGAVQPPPAPAGPPHAQAKPPPLQAVGCWDPRAGHGSCLGWGVPGAGTGGP